VENRGYTLLTIEDYVSCLKDAKLNVVAKDNTERWIICLKEELHKLTTYKSDFLKHFSEEDLNELVDGWKRKLERTQKGLQKWGLFIATKF